MVRVKKLGKQWQVRWDEWETILLPEGGSEKRRRQRARLCDRREEADGLARDIGQLHERGFAYEEAADRPVDTVETLTHAYVDARRLKMAGDTMRTEISFLTGFMTWAGPDLPVTRLDRLLLERYRDTLPRVGRKMKTAQRKLMAVEAMWDWGFDHDDTIKGVPKPRRVSDTLRTPPPITASANAMIADIDRMLLHLTNRLWHRHVGLLMRYTGVRVGQALGLRWQDVDLENGFLTLRISVRGSKGGKSRVLPLHHALAAEMSGWPRVGRYVICKEDGSPWRSDATLEPMRLAWERSGVSRDVWDHVEEAEAREDDRANGRPNHVFRAALRTELTAKGVSEDDCDLLLGHGRGFKETYVNSRFSPKMPALREIIELIPAHAPMSDTPGRTVRPKSETTAGKKATAAGKAKAKAKAASGAAKSDVKASTRAAGSPTASRKGGRANGYDGSGVGSM